MWYLYCIVIFKRKENSCTNLLQHESAKRDNIIIFECKYFITINYQSEMFSPLIFLLQHMMNRSKTIIPQTSPMMSGTKDELLSDPKPKVKKCQVISEKFIPIPDQLSMLSTFLSSYKADNNILLYMNCFSIFTVLQLQLSS